MCLVRSWNTKLVQLVVHHSIPSLNQSTILPMKLLWPCWCMYATSAKLLDTTLCFFDFEEINKLPCLTKNSKTDFLVLGQEDRHKKVLMNWRLDNSTKSSEFVLSWYISWPLLGSSKNWQVFVQHRLFKTLLMSNTTFSLIFSLIF